DDPVDPGATVVYTITYGNTGLAVASNVVIVETLPSNLTFVSATGGGTYNANLRTVTWNIGALAAQTTAQTVTFTATVADSGTILEGGVITNSQLTIDCDETDPVSQDTPETTTVNDKKAPETSGHIPAKGAVQVATDTIIQLRVTDGGEGVDASTVSIEAKVGDGSWETISDGSGEYDASGNATLKGTCYRGGAEDDYVYCFQPSAEFDYEKQVSVRVNASDGAGNPMDEEEYSFTTAMRSFGENARVNSGASTHDRPATAVDGDGDIWVVWEREDTEGKGTIYIARLPAGGTAFETEMEVAPDAGAGERRRPAIAIDGEGNIYVAFQEDDPENGWDIFVKTATTASPTTWSDIPTEILIPPDAAQNMPALAMDANGTVYAVWADAGDGNLYGADSSGWTVKQITNSGTASAPAIATESSGTVLHLLWVDRSGAHPDILYAATADGLPSSPLTGISIGDDAPAADQVAPAIAVSGAGDSVKVFAGWQDYRNGSTDPDIYFAETGSGFGTNILVNDDTTTAAQMRPAIGVDGNGSPYLVWADERSGTRNIYYAAATAIGDSVISPTRIDHTITNTLTGGAVTVVIPADALGTDIAVAVSEVADPPELPAGGFGVPYEFGPSGLEFSTPVTITITHDAEMAHPDTLRVYWYDQATGLWSREGISNVQHEVISETLHAVSFQTTHFSAFALGGKSGGGGGGGCAMSRAGEGHFSMLLLPLLAAVTLLIRRIRRRRRLVNG
ncbi:MAG: DUF11 domain-containing protein, partial [Planctomycetes bacterium]|nr:DUF11 domain-containing protein [Planctomycetota bacterium]